MERPIEFGCPRRCQHGTRARREMKSHVKLVTGCNAARWVQQIDMTCAVRLRIKGALYEQRADMTSAFQPGNSVACLEPKFKFRQPVARLQVKRKSIGAGILGKQDGLRNSPPDSTCRRQSVRRAYFSL